MGTMLAIMLAITLSWSDNSNNEGGFGVEKTISGNCIDGWFEVAQVGVNIATFVDDMAMAGDCYRVYAFNEDGRSNYTNTAQVPIEPDPCKNKGKKCR